MTEYVAVINDEGPPEWLRDARFYKVDEHGEVKTRVDVVTVDGDSLRFYAVTDRDVTYHATDAGVLTIRIAGEAERVYGPAGWVRVSGNRQDPAMVAD